MRRWLTRFLSGSIRRQLQMLVFGPVLAASLVGLMIQPTIQDDISHASKDAIRIVLVARQVATATTADQTAAILAATSETGLGVRKLRPEDAFRELSRAKSADAELRDIRDQLPASLSPVVQRLNAGGPTDQVVAVTLGDGAVLAFSPKPPPPIPLFDEDRVDFVLVILVVAVPVLLLSLYAGNMIMDPLTRFSRAAHDLDPDDGPERPFEEGGVHEISMLARALNDMRARIRGMIDERTRMVRAISHDLRTPLTRLRMRAERTSDEALRDAMLTDIARIDALIEETLTFLKREVSAETRLQVDLPSLLQMVCHDFANLDLPVAYDGPYRLSFDCKPQALVRAVTNLVENGVKFARTVTVRLKPLADGGVRIEVADDGPGIPPDLRDRVFEPFFKADASRAPGAPGGFGLGLSIVHDIVRGHDGSMVLLDGEPKGLVVRIDLPARGPKETGAYVRQSAPSPAAVAT